MDNKKFCFISCVNNKQYYNECLYYISKLNIPEGYTVEMLSIEDATSMTSGYNKAMKMTDAKYKIYLHQDTFILDEDILYVILDIFKDTNVGMIGAVGSKTISTEGYWWNTENIYGNYYDNVQLEMKKTKSLEESKEEYIELKAIDGFIMITQYDVPWREDIFDNWHYYDYSESIEFLKAGYKVVTPNIDKTWVMHDCGLVNSDLMDDYYKYNKVFVEEYYDFLFHNISVLVPIYNCTNIKKIKKELERQLYKKIDVTYLVFNEDKINENINVVRANNKIKVYENYDRLIKNFDRYFMIIDENQLLDNNIINKMYNKIQLDNVGAVVVDNSINEQVLESKESLDHIAKRYNEFINNPLCLIIDKQYYNNAYSCYFDKRYNGISLMATLCSIAKYSSIGFVNNNSKINLKYKDSLINYLELLQLENNLRKDNIFSNISEYKEVFNQIEDKICEIISTNKELQQDKVQEEVSRIIDNNKINCNIDFKNIGNNVVIEGEIEAINPNMIEIGDSNLIHKDCTFMIPGDMYMGSIKIGNNCDLGRRLFISSVNKVTIENDVIIASNVHIADHNHEYRKVGIPIMRQGVSSTSNEVVVGQGTWIGNGCVIVGNVKVGRGCVIGANSVVTKDIPDYCVAVGQPAKVVKYFDRNIGEWVKVKEEGQLEKYKESIKDAKPVFTIGIPTYNRSSYLERCLESIYRQIGNDSMIEVLVVNNASSDVTDKVVNKYKNRYNNLNYIKRKETISGDENISSIYKLGSGEFINSHGDDDYYSFGMIYEIVNTIFKKRNVAFVFTLPDNKKEIYYGKGIDDYIGKVSYMSTLITGLVINQNILDNVVSRRLNEFCLNQVFYQLESLLINEDFVVITGKIFTDDSGEHKPSGYNFGDIFIDNYLGLLRKYVGNGLSKTVYKIEKKSLLDNMIIPWIINIKVKNISLKLDGIINLFDDYYSDEIYYKKKRNIIEKYIN